MVISVDIARKEPSCTVYYHNTKNWYQIDSYVYMIYSRERRHSYSIYIIHNYGEGSITRVC